MLTGYVYAFLNSTSIPFSRPACSQNAWPWCQSEPWGVTLRRLLLPGRATVLMNLVPWNYHRQDLLQLMQSYWPHCREIALYQTIYSLELVFHSFNLFRLLMFHYWTKDRWNKRILNCKTSPKAKNCILLIYSFTKLHWSSSSRQCVPHEQFYSFPVFQQQHERGYNDQ